MLIQNQVQTRIGIDEFFSQTNTASIIELQSKFEASLVSWVVDTVSPFASVEQKSFVRTIRSINTGLTVSSRQTAQRIIKGKQTGLHERLGFLTASSATSATSASLTCESWSSRVHKGFMAVMFHWIDKEWNMKSVLLDFVCFKTPHTGKASYSMLMNIIKTWNLEKLVHSIKTDNAADIVRKVELLRAHLYSSLFIKINCSYDQFYV